MTQQPNLLFIYTDEQSAATMAAYGNNFIQMPNLNRLAAEGTVFDQAYVTQPVCTPSRSSLLTGLWPDQSGLTENNVPLPKDIPCLPEMLGEHDYTTAHYGKWHLGDEIFAQHGFQEWRGIEDGYSKYYSDPATKDEVSDYHKWLVQRGVPPENGARFDRGEAARLPEYLSKPAYLANEACDFLKRNQDNPFILYVNFLEPHMPFFGPRDDQYDPEQIPLPDNFHHEPGDDVPLKLRVLREAYRIKGHSGYPLATEQDWREMIARYWGLCSLVDTHVGRILDTLDQLGLDENTIVVFTSDHGDMMGSHGLLAKCVMYEEATRVPWIMRLPGQKQGRRVQGPISQIDMVPTLLELLNADIPSDLPGKSRTEWLKEDGPGRLEEDVFIEWNGPNSGIIGEETGNYWVPETFRDEISPEELSASVTDPVRTIVTADGWKFNRSTRGEHELYDLKSDPGETQNLAFNPDQQNRIEELSRRIDAWTETIAGQ